MLIKWKDWRKIMIWTPLVLGCRETPIFSGQHCCSTLRVAAVTHRVIRSCHVFFLVGKKIHLTFYKFTVKDESVAHTHTYTYQHTNTHKNTSTQSRGKLGMFKGATSTGCWPVACCERIVHSHAKEKTNIPRTFTNLLERSIQKDIFLLLSRNVVKHLK